MKNSVAKIIGAENQQSKGDEVDWERKLDITSEEVKATKDMEHLTDEQAEEVTSFIKTFSMLLYNLIVSGMKKPSEKNARVISLHGKKKNNKAA